MLAFPTSGWRQQSICAVTCEFRDTDTFQPTLLTYRSNITQLPAELEDQHASEEERLRFENHNI
jgi:hypothetical protein